MSLGEAADQRKTVPESPFWPGEYRFCPMCGTGLEAGEVGGVDRMVCAECGWVHFRNPGVGAAVLLRDGDGRVLLVRRSAFSTRPHRWCIPCGYVDYGEDVREAAAREVAEETGLTVRVGDPVFVATNTWNPEKHTVGVWFSGEITGGALQAGDDADEVGWFDLSDLPPLAFDTDTELLDRLRK